MNAAKLVESAAPSDESANSATGGDQNRSAAYAVRHRAKEQLNKACQCQIARDRELNHGIRNVEIVRHVGQGGEEEAYGNRRSRHDENKCRDMGRRGPVQVTTAGHRSSSIRSEQ